MIIFGRNVTEKIGNQKSLIFPTHSTSASSLPGEIGNPEIASFCYNTACCLANKDAIHLKYLISSNRSRALNTSRASNTGRGSDVIVLIEARP